MKNVCLLVLIHVILTLSIVNCGRAQTPAYRFIEKNGVIAMEAENADQIVGWKRIAGKSNQALQDTSAQGKGYFTFSIRIDQPGKYDVSLLCLAPNGDTSQNDCFVTLDGKKLYGADDQTRPDGMRCHTATFQWSSLPKGPGGHTPETIKEQPVYAKVETAGVHVLKMTSRSKGFCIDKIVLKLDDRTLPTGLGPEETFAAAVDTRGDLPSNFLLLPNYPNPFNAQTIIPVELSRSGRVQLVVYDVSGRALMTMADDVLPAGRHHFTFNAAGLTSATLIYRLTAGDGVISRGMTLVK